LVRLAGQPSGSRSKARSARGWGGGYRLAKPPGAITLLDVVEAAEGPVRGAVAPTGDTSEARRIDRLLQALCEKAAETVREHPRRADLADLAAE
jgi:DNA-binding IscR family transcriptional regulator